jgi:hypothetical protein
MWKFITGLFGRLLARSARHVVWGLAILVALAVGTWFAWEQWSDSTATALVRQGETAREVEVDAQKLPTDQVPVASVDSAGDVKLERVRVADPRSVEAVVTARGGEPAVLIRRRDVWFPELRAPGAGFSAEALEPGAADGVTVTPRPRSFFDAEVRPLAGAGAVGADSAARPSLYLGADLLRVGPLHGQLGVTRGGGAGAQAQTLSELAGQSIDVAPGAGLMLREDLMLTGAYAVHQGEVFFGVSYRF